MAPDDSKRLFTVPFGQPFLKTVAETLLSGGFQGTSKAGVSSFFRLADTTVLVPTNRAARALQETFLTLTPNGALLLPEIRPISQADEDLSLITAAITYEPQSVDPIPAAIDGLERELLLAELICEWGRALGKAAPEGIAQPAQALALARDLASLMDLIETEGVSLDAIDTLVPEDLADHWQKTTSFLKIIIDAWPSAIAQRGLLAPADRRNRLLRAEADRVRRDGASANPSPIVIAGVTGSIPATAELMRAVADHPAGAIVLPGLDLVLDETSYGHVRSHTPPAAASLGASRAPNHPEHPQFGLSGLLHSIGAERADVLPLGDATPRPRLAVRERILSEAMRPATTTGHWPKLKSEIAPDAAADALEGVSLISAPTALDEAEVVALILREALETRGQTAALITPDRLLARRVAVRLKAWGIEVDDSAGRPFRKTPPGALLDLILTVFETDFAPQAVVELLKHPLCRLALPAGDIRRRARNLEVAAFRTVYLGGGIGGIKSGLRHAERDADDYRASRPVHAMRPENWREAEDLVRRLEDAFAPLVATRQKSAPQPLAALASALVATAEAVARLPEPDRTPATSTETDTPSHELWTGEAGELASTLLARLMDETLAGPSIRATDFPDVYRTLVISQAVRPMTPVHPRLTIWGPYEARLQSVDVVILGGLNDRTWPEIPDTGPWLNRPMRRDLGLPQPEEKIGRDAHDFVQYCAAPRVIFTRAEKVDGVPTVQSRWLMRLMAVLKSVDAEHALAPDRPWLSWARHRSQSSTHTPVGQPAPCPPVALRPSKLSVTDIERWIANPYALYAAKILKLDKLDDIGQRPDAALKGMIVHQALARFTKDYPVSLPPDPARVLQDIARTVFAEYEAHPAVVAFWMPRFARFADWFGATEAARRAGLKTSHSEVAGKMVVRGETAKLDLTGRADRIDETDAGLIIYDYKSRGADGLSSMAKSAERLLQPQLPLEAAMAKDGAFTGVSGDVVGLAYISTSGGTPPGAEKRLDCVPRETGDRALADLRALIDLYADPATPYRAIRRGQFTRNYEYDDYAQLARVGEWRSDEEAGDDE